MIKIAAALAFTVTLFAQDDPPQNPVAPAGGRGGAAALAAANPQPFDKVITKDAKTKKGLFTVYQIGERFFFEIPKAELNTQCCGTRRFRRPRLELATAARRWRIAS